MGHKQKSGIAQPVLPKRHDGTEVMAFLDHQNL
jgi:hypothetical protein